MMSDYTCIAKIQADLKPITYPDIFLETLKLFFVFLKFLQNFIAKRNSSCPLALLLLVSRHPQTQVQLLLGARGSLTSC